MLKILKIRKTQGSQAIPDITAAAIREPFRGLPHIDSKKCSSCGQCTSLCPSDAIKLKPLSVDMGKCIFCGDCERECPEKVISFTTFYRIAADERNKLIVKSGITPEKFLADAITIRKEISSIFGSSLKLRQVSAAGCSGCEWELTACGNVNFDMGRFGIEIVASPRHADGLIITGPISENMAQALEDAYLSTPDPKIVILAGSCAISGGIFQESKALQRSFMEKHKIDLYIPGCPVHPLTVINGIIDLLRKG